MKRLLTYCFFCLLLTACSTSTSEPIERELEAPSDKVKENSNEVDHQLENQVQNITPQIVRKYGNQLDFCVCVQLNDSINQVDPTELNPAEMNDFMERWNAIEQQCKTLLLQSNATPEQRLLHKAKVKKCLNN